MSQVSGLAPVVLSLWAGSAVVMDWRSRRLPNALTLGGLLGALAWLLVFGQGAVGAPWRECLAAGGVAALLTLPAYALKAMGAGDVKLAVAMGLLAGLKILLGAFLVGGLVAGVLAVWLMARTPGRMRAAGRTVPFGTALGMGFILALWAVQLNWY